MLRAGHLLAVAQAALTVGIGDQQPSAFSDPRLLGLGMNHARLIVPWNAATTEPVSVQAWLDATAAAGMTPHVAFEHLRTDHCPGRPCVLPTRAQYGAAVRAFIARFPQVHTYTRTLRFHARHRPRRIRLTVRSAVPADHVHRIWVTPNT